MPHSDRNLGIKKSDFVAKTSLPSGVFFDFFGNGDNNKIASNDLITALGATGTIVQDGDPLGTPVLDVAGTVNQIRNLENGPGVKASVSVQNGIKLEHNFAIDATGEPLMQNKTATSPDFVSLVGKSPIVATTNGKTIELSFTGAQVIQVKTANYQVLVDDDIIHCNGTFTVTLVNNVSAVKEVTITCETGSITLAGDVTIQAPTTVAAGASVTVYPATGEWFHK